MYSAQWGRGKNIKVDRRLKFEMKILIIEYIEDIGNTTSGYKHIEQYCKLMTNRVHHESKLNTLN